MTFSFSAKKNAIHRKRKKKYSMLMELYLRVTNGVFLGCHFWSFCSLEQFRYLERIFEKQWISQCHPRMRWWPHPPHTSPPGSAARQRGVPQDLEKILVLWHPPFPFFPHLEKTYFCRYLVVPSPAVAAMIFFLPGSKTHWCPGTKQRGGAARFCQRNLFPPNSDPG